RGRGAKGARRTGDGRARGAQGPNHRPVRGAQAEPRESGASRGARGTAAPAAKGHEDERTPRNQEGEQGVTSRGNPSGSRAGARSVLQTAGNRVRLGGQTARRSGARG